MITTILLIISAILAIFSSTALFFSLRRINQYENLLVQIEQTISFASQKMKQVDSSGHYESDDETGFFFEEIKKLQTIFDDLFENEKEKK